MKKTLLLMFVLVAFISGCVQTEMNENVGMNEDVYNLGDKALQIANDYMNANIAGSDAAEQLDTIRKDLDSLFKEYGHKSALEVSNAVVLLWFSVKVDCKDLTEVSHDDVVKSRDDLAKLLNN